MRVALDATPLSVETGGIRRYTEQLAIALVREFPQDRYTLLSDQPFARVEAAAGVEQTHIECRRWWSLRLPRELARRGIDVFHGTDFAAPYLPLRPSVITIHDLSPWRFPEWQPGADRIRRRTPALVRLGLATVILTPSEAVRREVVDFFGVAPQRVFAVPLAPTPVPPAEPARDGRPYFLFLGTLEPRKNLDVLIPAWRPVFQTAGIPLVVAGRRRDGYPIPEEPGVEWLGVVPEERLGALYAGAVACVYPSRYEGFGLPVLEAMQCGAAVIASRDPAVMEVAGDAAELVDAADLAGWTNALRAAGSGAERFAGLRQAGRRRAAEFSWARTAALTRQVYAEALARF